MAYNEFFYSKCFDLFSKRKSTLIWLRLLIRVLKVYGVTPEGSSKKEF